MTPYITYIQKKYIYKHKMKTIDIHMFLLYLKIIFIGLEKLYSC